MSWRHSRLVLGRAVSLYKDCDVTRSSTTPPSLHSLPSPSFATGNCRMPDLSATSPASSPDSIQRTHHILPSVRPSLPPPPSRWSPGPPRNHVPLTSPLARWRSARTSLNARVAPPLALTHALARIELPVDPETIKQTFINQLGHFNQRLI